MKTFYIVTREDQSGDTLKVVTVTDDLNSAKGAMDLDVLDYTAQNNNQVDRFVLTRLTTEEQDKDALSDMSEDQKLSSAQEQEFKEIMRNSVKQILTIFTVKEMLELAMGSEFYALDLTKSQKVREFFLQTVTPFSGRYC